MRAAPGRVVEIEYTVRLEGGEVVETSADRGPVEYLHGGGQLMPALEREIEGMDEGDRRAFAIDPAEAYGARDEANVVSLPRALFPAEVALHAGARLSARTATGQSHPITVREVQGDQVVVDLNHPLAGQRLFFQVAVRRVRAAAEEELFRGRPQPAELV